jgi:DNA polymerase III epsilon subunit-like protein
MLRTNATYALVDFETTGKNAHTCQATEIACCIVDSRKLEILGEFNSLIKISEDKEYLAKYNLEPHNDEVLKKTHLTIEQLRAAPEPSVVWSNFTAFINQYNYAKNRWNSPILCGFNTINYDSKIIDRLCGHEPYNFGPFDKEYRCQALFNPVNKIDLMDIVYFWFSGINEPTSLSFDSLRQFFGMDASKAHSGIFDIRQTAELLIRFLKLTRNIANKTKFKGVFSNKEKE